MVAVVVAGQPNPAHLAALVAAAVAVEVVALALPEVRAIRAALAQTALRAPVVMLELAQLRAALDRREALAQTALPGIPVPQALAAPLGMQDHREMRAQAVMLERLARVETVARLATRATPQPLAH